MLEGKLNARITNTRRPFIKKILRRSKAKFFLELLQMTLVQPSEKGSKEERGREEGRGHKCKLGVSGQVSYPVHLLSLCSRELPWVVKLQFSFVSLSIHSLKLFVAFQETRENLADSLVLPSSTMQSKRDETGGKRRWGGWGGVKPSENSVAATTHTHTQRDLHRYKGLGHSTFLHTKTRTSRQVRKGSSYTLQLK